MSSETTLDRQAVRTATVKAFLEQGRQLDGSAAGADIDEQTTINAGHFTIDSLGFIRAFIALEDELDIELGDEALMQNQFATFGDVFAYVHSELEKQGR